jgi:hypothetical protein
VRTIYPELHNNALSHTSFFHQRIFDKKKKNNTTVVPTYTTVLFPQLETDLKGCHFGIPEVVKAESQVVLNTLTEHDFQDAVKK